MQSVKGGPDIPEKLLQAHEEGQVAFFCGAGISYPAKLPGFEGLVCGLSRAERNQNAPGQAPDDESWEEWLRRHEEKSRADPYERVGNRIIALRMLPLFENDPEGWNAIRRLPASEVRIGEFLTQWKEAADPQDRELIQRIEGALRPRSKQTTQ